MPLVCVEVRGQLEGVNSFFHHVAGGGNHTQHSKAWREKLSYLTNSIKDILNVSNTKDKCLR